MYLVEIHLLNKVLFFFLLIWHHSVPINIPNNSNHLLLNVWGFMTFHEATKTGPSIFFHGLSNGHFFSLYANIWGWFTVNLNLIFSLKMWASKNKTFMDSWWQHCTRCLTGGHVPCFGELELIQDGIRSCHS
jgi:hypothetical protein